MRAGCSVWWAVAGLLGTCVATAEAVADYPFIEGHGHRTENSMMRVTCETPTKLATGARVTWCSTTQTIVTKPSREQIDKQLADIDSLAINPEGSKELLKLCREMRKPSTGASPSDVDAQLVADVNRACKANDTNALWKTMRRWTSEVKAQTCKLAIHSTTYQFTQVDKDTWRHTSTEGLSCGMTLVLTLWRKPKGGLWNFQQVRSVVPNTDEPYRGMCEEIAKAPVLSFNWDDSHTRDLGCRYLEF